MKNLKFLFLPLAFIVVSCYVYKPFDDGTEEAGTAKVDKKDRADDDQIRNIKEDMVAKNAERTAPVRSLGERSDRRETRDDRLSMGREMSDADMERMRERMEKQSGDMSEEDRKKMEERYKREETRRNEMRKERGEGMSEEDKKRLEEKMRMEEMNRKKEEEERKKMKTEAPSSGRVIQKPGRQATPKKPEASMAVGIKGKLLPNQYYKIIAEGKQYKILTDQWEGDTLISHVIRKPKKVLKFHQNQIEEESIMERRFSKSYSDLITIGAYAAGGATLLLLLL